jgi:hypothetical protein
MAKTSPGSFLTLPGNRLPVDRMGCLNITGSSPETNLN